MRGDKISVIYNSLVFPPEATLVRNDALRREQGAGPRTQVLLCVAMFRPEKNQRELLEIVAGLPPDADWQLWLAGDGPARAACAAEVAARKLEDRVKFLGFQRDPAPLYGAADIAVHASWSEALSNFLIEAQAHGLPVVASEAQGIRECFLPDDTGWAIPRGDHAAFRAALQRLFAASPAQREKRAATAKTAARLTFDPGRQVAAYLDLFSRLLEDARRRKLGEA
jgi:glycosyltransferase involved in cell wall biosynthesis